MHKKPKKLAKELKKADKRRRPERKIEILQAVMALLEERNRKVTTAALASQVGLSEAALYRHFSGKAAIFQALVGYIEQHLLKPGNQLQDSGEPPLDQLRRLFEYHLRFFSDYPGLCRVFLIEGVAAESDSVREEMNTVVAKYTTQVTHYLRRARASGDVDDNLNVDEAAQMYVGIIQYKALRYIFSEFERRPMDEWESAWRLFLQAMKAR